MDEMIAKVLESGTRRFVLLPVAKSVADQPLWKMKVDLGQFERLNSMYLHRDPDDRLLTWTKLWSIVDNGGETIGCPTTYLQMHPNKLVEEVPAYMPNKMITIAEGQERTRFWSEYHDSTHSIAQFTETIAVVPGHAFGTDLPGTILKQLSQESGITLLTLDEFKALQQQYAPPEG